jgi:hypothetical protein
MRFDWSAGAQFSNNRFVVVVTLRFSPDLMTNTRRDIANSLIHNDRNETNKRNTVGDLLLSRMP